MSSKLASMIAEREFQFVRADEAQLERYFSRLGHNEFSTKFADGYGDKYIGSTNSIPYAKNIGVREIISKFRQSGTRRSPYTILDVFGGSGQISEFVKRSQINTQSSTNIVTADIECSQIEIALEKGLDAVALDATNMEIVADGSFEGAIIAYGLHHVPPERRLDAVNECTRVTKDGGRVVVHDGVKHGIMHKLSHGIVDLYSSNLHEFDHSAEPEFVKLCDAQRVENATTLDLFDPHVFFGATEEEVKVTFCRYYQGHYGLPEWTADKLIDKITDIYKYHSFDETECGGLHRDQQWVKNKPYANSFFVGVSDEEIILNTFGVEKPFIDTTFCLVVARYAKLLILDVKH